MDLSPLQLALGDAPTLLFTVLRVAAVYLGLLLLLRVAGGRQFGQLSTVDLVTLLLLSNVVQNAMIGPDQSLVGGLLGAGVLLLLYRVTTRWPAVRRQLELEPVVLIYGGQVLEGRLKREGVSVLELEEAVREHGVADLSGVETAVLEMNGMISVIAKEGVAPKMLKRVGSRRKR